MGVWVTVNVPRGTQSNVTGPVLPRHSDLEFHQITVSLDLKS